jgi:regulator of extracellular matrix RemA (YlzA/DUF370 family)
MTQRYANVQFGNIVSCGYMISIRYQNISHGVLVIANNLAIHIVGDYHNQI